MNKQQLFILKRSAMLVLFVLVLAPVSTFAQRRWVTHRNRVVIYQPQTVRDRAAATDLSLSHLRVFTVVLQDVLLKWLWLLRTLLTHRRTTGTGTRDRLVNRYATHADIATTTTAISSSSSQRI